MAVSEHSGGSQSATIDTEHTLATITDSGTYVFVVDTANMVNGDTLELRIYTKARSGGTSRLAYSASYTNLQAAPQKYSVPVPSNVEFVATLKQVDGTGRAFPWAVLVL